MLNEDIDESIDVDIVLKYMNNWLNDRPQQGIVAEKLTYCKYVKHRDEISFRYNYKSIEGFQDTNGNTSFNIPMRIYKTKSRNKSLDILLAE